jgi:hypothetical protein
LDGDFEPVVYFGDTLDSADEGVPFGMRWKIEQDGPDSLGRGSDLDLGSYFMHGVGSCDSMLTV